MMSAEIVRFPVEKRKGSPKAIEAAWNTYMACLLEWRGSKTGASGMDTLPDVEHTPAFDRTFRNLLGVK